jgi:hypothetical protein
MLAGVNESDPKPRAPPDFIDKGRYFHEVRAGTHDGGNVYGHGDSRL